MRPGTGADKAPEREPIVRDVSFAMAKQPSGKAGAAHLLLVRSGHQISDDAGYRSARASRARLRSSLRCEGGVPDIVDVLVVE
jgi:hypothetical protein